MLCHNLDRRILSISNCQLLGRNRASLGTGNQLATGRPISHFPQVNINLSSGTHKEFIVLRVPVCLPGDGLLL